MKKLVLSFLFAWLGLGLYGQTANPYATSYTINGLTDIGIMGSYYHPFFGPPGSPSTYPPVVRRALKVTFWVDEDPLALDDNHLWNVDLILELEIRDFNGQADAQSITLPLETQGGEHILKSIALFEGIFQEVELNYVGINNGNVPLNCEGFFHIRFEWIVEEHVSMSANAVPDLNQAVYSSSTRELQLSWNSLQPYNGQDYFDVEWLFLTDGTPNPSTGPCPVPNHKNDALPFSFDNAARIRTNSNSYRISMAYPKGSLIFRVRAIGKDAQGNTVVGPWTYDPSTPLLSQAHQDNDYNNIPCTFYLDFCNQLQPNKNWQYTASFSENGKKKEVINFADGSLRIRQTVTFIGDNALVGETKYDLDGRPAMNVLPVATAFTGMDYYTNDHGLSANGSESDGRFVKENFFSDDRLDPNHSIHPADLPINATTVSLSANYYSPSNPLNFENKDAIPDASGWVYSQTKYKNDGTDRPIEVAGVGETFRMNGNHTTRYYYVKPTQAELDRLFGNEVGEEQFYEKSMVVDPNGQVSVSYLDNKGRTIATALAGDNPNNLQALENEPAYITSEIFTTNEVNVNGVISSSMPIGISIPGTVVDISYDLTSAEMEGCSESQSCAYDITIRIKNYLGETIESWTETNVTDLSNIYSYEFTDIGSYTLEREVKLVNQSVEAFLQQEEDYLSHEDNMEDNDCVPYWLDTKINCPEDDCQSQCEAVYKIISNGITYYLDAANNRYELINNDTEYRNVTTGVIYTKGPNDPITLAIAACVEDCEDATNQRMNQNPCRLMLQRLITDLSPGGQLFSNRMNENIRNNDGTLLLEADGEINKVVVRNEEYVPSGWLESYIPNYLSLINAAHGTNFTSYNQLITGWKPAYAQNLLIYHPEYCAYLYTCDDETIFCGLPGHEYMDTTMIYDYLNQMYYERTDDYANGIGFTHNYNFFNPFGLPSNNAVTIPFDDYSQYTPIWGSSNTGTDHLFSCTDPNSLSVFAQNFIMQRMQQFLPVTDPSGQPTGMYYSVWFWIEDPLDIHLGNGSGSIHPNIISLFQSLHGDGGSNPGVLQHMTKYEMFRAIYDYYRRWAIYEYFDDEFECPSAQFADATYADNKYRFWDLDEIDPGLVGPASGGDPNHIPNHIDAIVSQIPYLGVVLMYPRNLLFDWAQNNAIPSSFAGTSFDPNANPATNFGRPDLDCKCNELVDLLGTLYDPQNPNYGSIAQYLNSQLGTSYLAINAENFLKCTNAADPDQYTYIPNLHSSFDCDPTLYEPLDCEARQMQQHLANARANYLDDLDAYMQNKAGEARSVCYANFDTRETMSISYLLAEYHYTLYYYDQAGNLVKTVPPKGVMPLDEEGITQASFYRQNPALAAFQRPEHKMATKYQYNSLNQLVAQNTPDGGTTQFWYDTEGRLRLSQNAEQTLQNNSNGGTQTYYGLAGTFSYTRYDDLSRITEVGELACNTSPDDEVASGNFKTDVQWQNWFNGTLERQEVTYTQYTARIGAWTTPTFTTGTSLNRNRVVASYIIPSIIGSFDPVNNGDYANFNHATHYQYDIHGNVKELVQDYANAPADRYKRMVYTYDLISGNVTEVAYQPNESDAFYHRYSYDADLRIIKVETSSDKLVWQTDAEYTYYPHGPLARTELGGNRKLQGTDFAYTLQGWLKFINGGSMEDPLFDIGQDRAGGTTNADYLEDVFCYTLGYYQNDYESITYGVAGGFVPDLIGVSGAGSFHSVNKSLYNGNISYSISGIDQLSINSEDDYHLVNMYHYDQLNRLVSYKAYKDASSAIFGSNEVSGITEGSFQANYTYDANGNLMALNRWDKSGSQFDELDYNYDDIFDANPTNKLWYVTDLRPSGTSLVDIDNQQSDNYDYDAIGNLIKDKKENISNIDWTVYGKIKKVSGPGVINFEYDPSGNRVVKKVQGGEHLRYVRDASGNVMAVYSLDAAASSSTAIEHHIYGSSRLGISTHESSSFVESQLANTGGMLYTTSSIFGNKAYELTNHLGNVMITLSDKKAVESTYFVADVISFTDYYPFGSPMPGRYNTPSEKYRHGFNGMEKDDELKGDGNSYDFGARVYDPRVGRWLTVDPLAHKQPAWSTYKAFLDNPIIYLDPGGETEYYHQGKWIGTDGQDNGLIAIVSNKDVAESMKENTENGLNAPKNSVLKNGYKGGGLFVIHKDVLTAAVDLLSKQRETGNTSNGEWQATMNESSDGSFDYGVEPMNAGKHGRGISTPEADVSMHGHSMGEPSWNDTDQKIDHGGVEPSGYDGDRSYFEGYEMNIIVGRKFYNVKLVPPSQRDANDPSRDINDNDDWIEYGSSDVIQVYDSNSKSQQTITEGDASSMLEKPSGRTYRRYERNKQNSENENK